MAERRRVNLKGILADQDLRRDLMVPTIQALQAREGIDTSREQERERLSLLEARTRAIITRLEAEMNGDGPDTHSSARVAAAMNLAKILGITADQVEHKISSCDIMIPSLFKSTP